MIPIKAAVLFFQSKLASYFFFVLALNNNNSVDYVIVFYIIPSSLVLNLSKFLSSAEHKWYFKECGKPNSFWSSVTLTVFYYFYQSQCGPATVWFSTFKIPYFVFSTRTKLIQVWDNMWVSKYNDDINTIWGWTIPLMTVGCMFSSVPLRPARVSNTQARIRLSRLFTFLLNITNWVYT